MGATVSTVFSTALPQPAGIYQLLPAVRRWRSRFQMLRFAEVEISHLYHVYKLADLTLKNCVKTAHLMSYLKVEDIQFAKRMLSAFNSGARFEGFVFEIWDICTVDETDLADFVFDMYDTNRCGDISAAQAHIMMKELYGEGFLKQGSKKSEDIMLQLFNKEDVSLGVEKFQFRAFTKKQPSVLFLAFSVQKSIIRGVVGSSFWKCQAQRRKEFSGQEMIVIHSLRVDILLGRCPIAAEDMEEEKPDKDAQRSLTKNLSVRDRSYRNIDNRGKLPNAVETPTTALSANTSSKSQKGNSFRKVGRGSGKFESPQAVAITISPALSLDAGLGIVSVVNGKQKTVGVSKKMPKRRVMDNANEPDSYVTDHNQDLSSRLGSPTGNDLIMMEKKLQDYDRIDKHKVKIERERLEQPGAAALEDAMEKSTSHKGHRQEHRQVREQVQKRGPDKQVEGSEVDSPTTPPTGTSFIPSFMFREKLRALSPLPNPPEEEVSKRKKSPKKKKEVPEGSERVKFDIPGDGTREQSDS